MTGVAGGHAHAWSAMRFERVATGARARVSDRAPDMVTGARPTMRRRHRR
jgi:hypothetical protein